MLKKTKFDTQLVKSLITSSILKVPGIFSVDINDKLSDFNRNYFVIKIDLHEDVVNVLSVANEARNLVYYELSKQLNDDNVVINMIINC